MSTLKRAKLGKDFFLLWQGQLVSGIGDALYAMALGFFVLQQTGSKALMGAIMACGVLPVIIFAPFAGAIADRANRRNLIVWMDIIRGVLVLLACLGAHLGFLQVWHLFIVAAGLGICTSLFSPAVNALLPDITSREKLIKANSMMGYNESIQQVLGGPIGGLVYTAVGAPLLFLINGVSYILSAISERFIKPVQQLTFNDVKKDRDRKLIADIKAGITYVWRKKGMRALMYFAFFSNFFGQAAIFLILPFFNEQPDLNPRHYGFVVAAMAIGAALGTLITTFIPIRENARPRVFAGFFLLTCISFGTMLFMDFHFLIMVAALGAMGASVFNILLKTSFQQSTPSYMRGKVFSLINMGINGLVPLAWIVSGVLAEVFPMPWIAAVSCAISFLLLVVAISYAPLRDFLAVREADGGMNKRAQ